MTDDPFRGLPTGGPVAVTTYQRQTLDASSSRLAGRAIAEWLRWAGQYVPGTVYHRHDVVRDGQWLMVCTTDKPSGTDQRPAPFPVGQPSWLYDGTEPVESPSAAQATWGHRYTFDAGYFVNKLRVYGAAGSRYTIAIVDNPATDPQPNVIWTGLVNTTGWFEWGLGGTPVPSGSVFDVFVIQYEPDPAPTTWFGNWNYRTPNNQPATPGIGECIHRGQSLGELRIHKIDDDLDGRGSELLALNVGDIITPDLVNESWAVQNVTDEGDWVRIGVSPAVQYGPDGVRTFKFDTVAPQPLTHIADPGFWTGNLAGAIQGFRAIDGSYDDAIQTLTDDAYGIDLELQEAFLPTEWDLMTKGAL